MISMLSNTTIANIFCDSLIIMTLIIVMLKDYNKIKLITIILVIVSMLSFVISYLQHPEYQTVLFNTYNIWDRVFGPRKGFFLLMILTMYNDPKELFSALKASAIPVWIAYTIRALTGIGLSEKTGSNHAFGYWFLFVAIIYAIAFIRERRFYELLLAVIPLIQIVLYASRTCILSYVVFWGLYILFYEDNKDNLKKKIVLICIAIILSVMITSNVFMDMIKEIIQQLGISSKILNAILSGNNELDGGRAYMYANDAILLKENPWGLGIYWDRYLYPSYNYTHNFFYEVLIDFGWLIGGFLIVVLLMRTISILRASKSEWKLLFIMFFSLSMVRLFLSYSFWFDINFWGMIAILICYNYNKETW